MKLPRSVRIMGRDYKVRRKRMKCFGLCDFDAGIIWIKGGLADEPSSQTLLHEIVHAILHESGHHHSQTTGENEALVRALEHGLWRAGYRLCQ